MAMTQPTTRRGHKAGAAAPGEGTTRERILRTSAELFARNGYHATGMAELSAATRLSRGSLYHHMDGKESILYEICRGQITTMNAEAEAIVGQSCSDQEKFRLLGRALMHNISDHLAEWTVFFKEFGALSAERRAEVIDARDDFEGYWTTVLRGVVGDSVPDVTLVVAAKGVLGMFNYAYLWFRPDGRLSVDQTADVFVDLVLAGLVHGLSHTQV